MKPKTLIDQLKQVKHTPKKNRLSWVDQLPPEARREFIEIAQAYESGKLEQWPSRSELVEYLRKNPDKILSETLAKAINTLAAQSIERHIRERGKQDAQTG